MADELIELKDGFLTPISTVRLLLKLEGRGKDIHSRTLPPGYDPRVVDGQFVVTPPRGSLSEAQRQAIRRERGNLVDLIAYCERME